MHIPLFFPYYAVDIHNIMHIYSSAREPFAWPGISPRDALLLRSFRVASAIRAPALLRTAPRSCLLPSLVNSHFDAQARPVTVHGDWAYALSF